MMTRLFAHPIPPLAAEVDRLFNSIFTEPRWQAGHVRPGMAWVPPMNAWEDDQNVYVEVEVPGLTMENLELLIQNDELTLRGRRESASQELIRQERWSGQFERTITLPAIVESEKAEAHLNNGVLAVTLPKAASARPRKIEIRTLPESR